MFLYKTIQAWINEVCTCCDLIPIYWNSFSNQIISTDRTPTEMLIRLKLQFFKKMLPFPYDQFKNDPVYVCTPTFVLLFHNEINF